MHPGAAAADDAVGDHHRAHHALRVRDASPTTAPTYSRAVSTSAVDTSSAGSSPLRSRRAIVVVDGSVTIGDAEDVGAGDRFVVAQDPRRGQHPRLHLADERLALTSSFSATTCTTRNATTTTLNTASAGRPNRRTRHDRLLRHERERGQREQHDDVGVARHGRCARAPEPGERDRADRTDRGRDHERPRLPARSRRARPTTPATRRAHEQHHAGVGDAREVASPVVRPRHTKPGRSRSAVDSEVSSRWPDVLRARTRAVHDRRGRRRCRGPPASRAAGARRWRRRPSS